MNKLLLCALAGSTALVSCNMEPQNMISSVDFESMDTTVAPGADFYQFANGTWLRENPVPETESRWGSFNELQEENNKKIKALIQEATEGNFPKGDAMQHIGDFYQSFMDSTKRNEVGAQPILDLFESHLSLSKKEELTATLANLYPIGFSALFGTSIYEDLRQNDRYAVYVGAAGYGLPDKDYYFKTDEKSVETRAEYVKHVNRMFALAMGENAPSDAGERILAIETQFSEKAKNRVEQRDIEASYNKMSLSELQSLCPIIDWNAYLKQVGVENIDTVIVGNPAYMEAANAVINATDLNEIKLLLQWEIINGSAGKLSDELIQANFDFYGTYMRGTKEMKPRWKRAIDAMNYTLGESLGKAFVSKHFPESSKQKVNEMVSNLMVALKDRLADLDWMSDSTKQNAFLKMESFTRKLGYPDVWKDLSALEITSESYFKNWMAVRRFNVQDNISKLGKPVDKTEWGMPAHIVNAYYNPVQNEIVFPAGIMQAPFFDPGAEDAVNYARMGAVIGHEMIHGFDDQGAQFDAHGNFTQWWTESDFANFQERTKQLEEQYNGYEALEGLNVNGKLTLGENIADFGGLTVAYYAFKKAQEGKKAEVIGGYNPDQRFFIAFGQIWKSNYTEAALRQRVLTDPHSPTMFRVNGTLANMPEFFDAFGIKEEEAMRNAGEDLITIW